MSEYKMVGMSNEPHQPLEHPPLVPFIAVPGNYIEPGIAVERVALSTRRSDRPTGVPFVIPSPKNYAHMEDASPVPQSGSDQVRAVGKPFIQELGE